MNFKKRFNKRIEEDKRSMLTESDMAYLATLQSMVVERPEGEVIAKPLNYKKPLLISVACFLAVALALSLVLYFTLQKPKDVFFRGEDYADFPSSLEELNSDLNDFSLTFDEDSYILSNVSKARTDRGDTLYYNLYAYSEQGVAVQLKVVVNKYYINQDLELGSNVLQTTISGHTLKYVQNSSSSPIDGYQVINCKGEINIGTQWIYVMQYQEYSLDEGTFVDFMQSIIQIK